MTVERTEQTLKILQIIPADGQTHALFGNSAEEPNEVTDFTVHCWALVDDGDGAFITGCIAYLRDRVICPIDPKDSTFLSYIGGVSRVEERPTAHDQQAGKPAQPAAKKSWLASPEPMPRIP